MEQDGHCDPADEIEFSVEEDEDLDDELPEQRVPGLIDETN